MVIIVVYSHVYGGWHAASPAMCPAPVSYTHLLYVIKGFLGRETNATFIEWYIRLLEFVNGKTNVYCYMENNKLQDPFCLLYTSRCV